MIPLPPPPYPFPLSRGQPAGHPGHWWVGGWGVRGGGGVVTILTPLSLSVIWCRNIPDSQGHSLWSRAWLHSGRWEIIASLGKGLEVIWRSFTIVSSLHLGRAEYTKISHLRSEGMGRPEPPSKEGGVALNKYLRDYCLIWIRCPAPSGGAEYCTSLNMVSITPICRNSSHIWLQDILRPTDYMHAFPYYIKEKQFWHITIVGYHYLNSFR